MQSTRVTQLAERIVVEGLTKRYGTLTAVQDLWFSVRAGAVTGFLGPNGAGKTTALTKAAALAGGRIAYQTQRSRGKQPQWYTRTSPDRRLIKNLYAPRPRWRVDGVPADA